MNKVIMVHKSVAKAHNALKENVDKAQTVVVIKRSMRSGYAGIDNELYGYDNCLMYFGDAKEAISKLIAEIKANIS